MQSLAISGGKGLNIALILSMLVSLGLPLTVGAKDMMEEGDIFVSIRVYEGLDPADQEEAGQLIADGFLPIMRESEGFVGYYLLSAEDILVTVSLFERAEQASASNVAARDFVAEYLLPFLPDAPRIVKGLVDVIYVAMREKAMMHDLDDESGDEDVDGEMIDDNVTSLYAALRLYDNYDLSRLDEANEVVETILLPAQQDAGGLFSYFSMNDGMDVVAALSIYGSEENALAANDIAAEIVGEHMAEWLPDDPLRINGGLAVAALAGLHEGANLIDETMDG